MDISDIDIDINPDYTMMKKMSNGMYLSQEQIDILEEYRIDYLRCHSLKELIREIEKTYEDIDDDVLYNLLNVLAERDYYENYNK